MIYHKPGNLFNGPEMRKQNIYRYDISSIIHKYYRSFPPLCHCYMSSHPFAYQNGEREVLQERQGREMAELFTTWKIILYINLLVFFATKTKMLLKLTLLS